MTYVRVYFTKYEELVEELEIDLPRDEIDGPTVTDALRAAYALDNVKVADYEIVREIA